MANSIVTTIRGRLNTSIDIILDKVQHVGDIISFKNIIGMVPQEEDYTQFFYQCIQFCSVNGNTRLFRVDDVLSIGGRMEIRVSPVTS